MVCWAPNSSSGYTFHKGLRLKGKNLISDRQGISGPVAICDMSKFRSNYEVDPLIRQKLNFPMFLSDAKEVLIEAREESRKNQDESSCANEDHIIHRLSCLKLGVNDDGSHILFMNILDGCHDRIVQRIHLGANPNTLSAIRSDYSRVNVTLGTDNLREYNWINPPFQVDIDLWNIESIHNGYIKYSPNKEFWDHDPEFVGEGDLAIGDVGTSLDMLQKVDQAKKLEVISGMRYGDCAFVKRSDGHWTLAYIDDWYFRDRGGNRGIIDDEAVYVFIVDCSTNQEKHIPERKWLSSIRLRNTSKYRDAINTLDDLDDSSNDHTHEPPSSGFNGSGEKSNGNGSRKSSPGANDDRSVSSLSEGENGSVADCSNG